MLGDLDGAYDPDADVRESIVDWLLGVARAAAFGEKAVALDREGGASAIAMLEAVAREPMRLQVRIRHGRSRIRYPEPDFFVEIRAGDALLAEGAANLLSAAIMHAARTLARG
jgi:hypothetical protein